MFRLVAIILMFAGITNSFISELPELNFAKDASVSVSSEAAKHFVADSTHKDANHKHGCSDSDPCGHVCHFGHCSVVLPASDQFLPNVASNNNFNFICTKFKGYFKNPIKPPIA